MADIGVTICEDNFGEAYGEHVRRFTLTNEKRVSCQVITYGATITCIKAPDRKGNVDDVVLGFDNIEGYLDSSNAYFGATIGRVANRVFPTDVTIAGRRCAFSQNVGETHLHGGFRGFDKVIWDANIEGSRVVMNYYCEDGEEGLPGAVLVTAVFQLTADSRLAILYKATPTKPTPINITSHSYFNLAGQASGAQGLYNHIISINADTATVLKDLVATGDTVDVSNTVYDLRVPRQLGSAIDKMNGEGFDINYCLNNSTIQPGFNYAARLYDPGSGRVMEVHCDQPGLQFYTSNSLSAVCGKKGAVYGKHSALCLETQAYPNAIHFDHFPSIIVRPGSEYKHLVTYSFGVVPAFTKSS